MRKKIVNILLICFSLIASVYPFSYGITNISNIILFITIYIFINKYHIFSKIKINEDKYIWLVLIFAIISRIGIVIALNKNIIQVSDFKYALTAAMTGDFTADYYRAFTHWILYPAFVNVIFKIFGYSQFIALLINAIILIMVSVLIFLISTRIFKNKKYGLISALFYIFWPSNILYTIVFTQEHLCSLLLLLGFYTYIKVEEIHKMYKKNLLSFLAGFWLALSAFCKNFAPVFVIAIIIYSILKFIKEYDTKKLKVTLINTLVLLLSFISVKQLIYTGIDKLATHKVSRDSSSYYLKVGLTYGISDKKTYDNYFETLKVMNYDYEKINKFTKQEIKETIKNKNSSVREKDFFVKKAQILFNGENQRNSKLKWIKKSIINNNLIKFIDKYIIKVNEFYYAVIMFLNIIGLIYLIKTQNLKIFLTYLIIFGTALMLILVEVQNRYLYSLSPFFCIILNSGILTLTKFTEKNVNK